MKLNEQSYADAVAEEKQFRSLLPTTGFFNKYMLYTDRHEAPGSFHFWIGVTLLGACLQRRCWVSKGVYNVFPNLYTILVAPSGKCRKSRAMRIGCELVESFPWINIIADKTTPEGLLGALQYGTQGLEAMQTGEGATLNMQTDSSGLITASELAVFLNKQTYTTGIVGILTDLTECRPTFKYITRNKTPIILKNPIISMLGASTPDWLATSLPEAAFEGGFMSRILFIVKFFRDRHITFPQELPIIEQTELKTDIMTMRGMFNGEIKLSTDAREWFDQWYMSAQFQTIEDITLGGFIERKPDITLQLGMLIAISKKELTITLETLRQAVSIITWTQERMFKAFDKIDLSPLGQIRYKVLELLNARGQISRREIVRKFAGKLQSYRQIEEIEHIMIAAGEMTIGEYKADSTKPGRGVLMYYSTIGVKK